jgi:hypothetical protein
MIIVLLLFTGFVLGFLFAANVNYEPYIIDLDRILFDILKELIKKRKQ